MQIIRMEGTGVIGTQDIRVGGMYRRVDLGRCGRGEWQINSEEFGNVRKGCGSGVMWLCAYNDFNSLSTPILFVT